MADRTESSIDIDAKPGEVLDVIADFESYPAVGDRGEEGQRSSPRRATAGPTRSSSPSTPGAIKDTYTLDYEWDVAKNGTGVVSWSLVEATVLKAMNGSYTLAAKGKDATTVTYRLAVDVKIPMLGMLKRKAEKVIIDTALKSLKKRVEG